MTDHDALQEPRQTASSDELAVFSTIVSALQSLDYNARVRLFRTITTFFDFPNAQAQLAQPVTPSLYEKSDVSEVRSQTTSFSEDRSPSAKAFLLDKKPQTDVERIACLAYYLAHYREQPSFKTLDLSKLNTEAAQVKFSNPTKAVENAAAAHLLIQAGQGKKQISAIGELYVQALPDRVAARAAVEDVRKRRARPKPRLTKLISKSADDSLDVPISS